MEKLVFENTSSMYDSSDEKMCIEGVTLRPLVTKPEDPVKKVTFSAYSRGIPHQKEEEEEAEVSLQGEGVAGTPLPSPCLTKGCAMGYTMLFYDNGHHYGYTEWVKFPGPSNHWKPDWATNYGTELYNHTADPFENENIHKHHHNGSFYDKLRDTLHGGWIAAKL